MTKLKIFTEDEIESLISWIESKELCLQWAGPNYTYPLTRTQLLNALKESSENDSLKIYSVYDEKNDEIIGHIQLRIDKLNNSARIGKVLIGNKKYLNKGYGTDLIKKILKKGFIEFKLHRIELGVFDFNIGAIKSYTKAGFNKEGVLRDYRKNNDDYWSLINMSILEGEYYSIYEVDDK